MFAIKNAAKLVLKTPRRNSLTPFFSSEIARPFTFNAQL